MSDDGNNLSHQSGVNKDGQPFVQLILNGDIIGQMTPADARDHAQAMIEAAEAAEQDAFILFFGQSRLGLPRERAAQLMIEFRTYRELATAKRGGPVNPKDWIYPKGEPT